MAALEVADPDAVDAAGFAEYLSAQQDLGAKGVPRLLRLSLRLPVTGSNKVLKRELQAQRWRCDEPVYRWAGRGRPEYHLMGDADLEALEAEFARHGRERYL
jgi:fatty-acyl-CoA synthase